jgi:hypothetical protein
MLYMVRLLRTSIPNISGSHRLFPDIRDRNQRLLGRKLKPMTLQSLSLSAIPPLKAIESFNFAMYYYILTPEFWILGR